MDVKKGTLCVAPQALEEEEQKVTKPKACEGGSFTSVDPFRAWAEEKEEEHPRQDPGSKILDSGSRILDPGSRILNPGSRMLLLRPRSNRVCPHTHTHTSCVL